MRGNSHGSGKRRYWKFAWSDLSDLPTIGKVDYQPKNGASRIFGEGTFQAEYLQLFPAIKAKEKLKALDLCVYCGRNKDCHGEPLVLTNEHVIPEFLGAGLELPNSSCSRCQNVTSRFEDSIAREMFDPVRKSFNLGGKSGILPKSNFPLDIGREVSEKVFIPLVHYPTILVMPALFPASSYSSRPKNGDDPFNFRMYNINADAVFLKKYAIEKFSSQSIDMVRFAQMIAKIAHVYATHYFGAGTFAPALADFIRTDYSPKTPAMGYFDNVGSLWQMRDKPSVNLHEIEVGKIEWDSFKMHAVRVRLFASYEMPSYYVSVGKPMR